MPVAEPLPIRAYAEQVNVGERTLRRYANRRDNPMPGCTRGTRGALLVDPDVATPWLRRRENSPRTQRKQPLELIAAPAAIAVPPADPPVTEPDEALVLELGRVDRLLNALLATVESSASVDGPAWDRYTAMSKRREQLQAALVEHRERADRFMERREHVLIVTTLFEHVRQEIEGIPATMPESLMDQLTRRKLRLVGPDGADDGRRSLRALADSLEAEVREVLERLAKRLDRTTEGKQP